MKAPDNAAWDILRWAAGAKIEAPQYEHIDARRLLDLVVAHRLGPRLLRRLKEESVRPRWLSDAILAHLRGQNAKTIAQIELRMRALREIGESLPEAPPLILKGFSAYAATGDRRFIRPSGDLDLLPRDAAQLARVMRGLGYGIVAAPASAHEYATAARGSVGIELHRFFPVYAFPPGVEAEDWEPRKYLREQNQDFAAPSRREVSFSDIWPHAVASRAPELAGMRVPDVTTTAFLLCAHEFRELIQSPFELPIPVRMALLADIHDLARHADFDASRFAELCTSFDGCSSARVIGRFLHEVFGANVLPVAPSHIEKWPRQIGVRGAWAAIASTRECLLGLCRATILERLEVNEVRVPVAGEAVRCELAGSTAGCAGAISLRAIVHKIRCTDLPLSLVLTRREDGVGLQVLVPLPDAQSTQYRVRLDMAEPNNNSRTLDIIAPLPRERGSQRNHQVSAEGVSFGELGCSIEWVLPPQSSALLLSVARRDGRISDFYDATSVVAVPLRLCS